MQDEERANGIDVKRWWEQGELPFPNFAPQKIGKSGQYHQKK